MNAETSVPPNGGERQDNSGAKSHEAQGFFFGPPQTEGDKILEASENFLAAQEKQDEREQRKLAGQSIKFEFRRPKDILRHVVVPPYSLDDAPSALAYLAYNYAQATGYDHGGVLVAGVAAAASLIHDGVQIQVRPESGWYESARLWGLLIGPPSSGKTPEIKAAAGHIQTMHAQLVQQWEQAAREQEEIAEAGGAVKDIGPKPALFTSTATIAAMEELLKKNPQGVLLQTGEFGSWIGMIDGATRGEGAANRGDWLQLYDGGPRQSNRISRGDSMIPNWSACVLAGVQPETLQANMRNMPEDGLIHRFIPCIMQASTKRNPNADARYHQQQWNEWLAYLRRIPPQIVMMSPEALAAFDAEVEFVRELARAAEDFAPSIAAQLGKHGGQLARLVLTYHCLTATPNQTGLLPPVSLDTVQRAIRFLRTARRHVGSVFNEILTTSAPLSLARSLARSIVAEVGALDTIGRNWMANHCTEFKKADDRVRREAVQMLQDADWLEEVAGSRYSGWPTKWSVHHTLHARFGKEGEEWRKHRAAVRQLITGDDPEDWE